MTLDLYEEFRGLTRALEAAGVEYAIVGALALAVHGVPRATNDIDLLVQPESVSAAQDVARAREFDIEADPLIFPDGMVLHRANKFEGSDFLTLDLIVANRSLAAAWASRIRVELDDGPMWVVSRDGLIAMKAAAGRPSDLADIARLREQDR